MTTPWTPSHTAGPHHRWKNPDQFSLDVSKTVTALFNRPPGYILACGFGGIPTASVVAERLHWPLALVRKSNEGLPRADWLTQVLVGARRADVEHAYIIEDCLCTGKTMAWIIDAYEGAHGSRLVTGAFVLDVQRYYTRNDLCEEFYGIRNNIKVNPWVDPNEEPPSDEHGPTSTSSTGETASSAPLGF
jgi:adenine/guanine phosphoribosyltransferase-like PRPP-binding protein